MLVRNIFAAVAGLVGLAHGLEASTSATAAGGVVSLFSEPDFQGTNCTVNSSRLQNGQCFTLPSDIKAKSVTKNGFKCCILYRSPCPANILLSFYSQTPGFLNQRVYSDIADLEPLGWAGIVRSVICPNDDFCDGIMYDKDFSPKLGKNMAPVWLDVIHLPGRLQKGA
ncbi:hypothetical protein B0T17DRAFT_512031 [Bombardia bombarda]|uniref:Uncharacterized protein n=1 Tax=Bombardia bombarda TaxID=252184 RepID=A0AA39TMH6_9PEZI|nr:hypothetical protein B0T17DRAFT_512031 [Bombardia bombarda]